MRLVTGDGLNATQWFRRALTSSGRQALRRISPSSCYSWKLVKRIFGLPWVPPHRELVFKVLISPKTPWHMYMPWKIWLLCNSYDYGISITIMSINHYLCLTIMWYSYNNGKQSFSFCIIGFLSVSFSPSTQQSCEFLFLSFLSGRCSSSHSCWPPDVSESQHDWRHTPHRLHDAQHLTPHPLPLLVQTPICGHKNAIATIRPCVCVFRANPLFITL